MPLNLVNKGKKVKKNRGRLKTKAYFDKS